MTGLPWRRNKNCDSVRLVAARQTLAAFLLGAAVSQGLVSLDTEAQDELLLASFQVAPIINIQRRDFLTSFDFSGPKCSHL